MFYSNVNSSTQKVSICSVSPNPPPSPLNGAQFISLGFLIYIYFVQKYAKTIFNSVILTQLIVFLCAISSFMCKHLLLKKNCSLHFHASLYFNSICTPFSSSLC